MNADAYLAGAVSELETAISAEATEYQIIRASGLLREFIIDDALRQFANVAREHPTYVVPKPDAVSVARIGGVRIADVSLEVGGRPIKRAAVLQLNADGYNADELYEIRTAKELRRVVAVRYDTETFTVGDVIRLAANSFGGAHFSDKHLRPGEIVLLGLNHPVTLHAGIPFATLSDVAASVRQIAHVMLPPLRRLREAFADRD